MEEGLDADGLEVTVDEEDDEERVASEFPGEVGDSEAGTHKATGGGRTQLLCCLK